MEIKEKQCQENWYEKPDSGVYMYNNELGVLLPLGDAENLGFTNYENEIYDVGFFAFSKNQGLMQLVENDKIKTEKTYDDIYAGTQYFSDIVIEEVCNVENTQHLIEDWVSVGYYNDDYIQRIYIDYFDNSKGISKLYDKLKYNYLESYRNGYYETNSNGDIDNNEYERYINDINTLLKKYTQEMYNDIKHIVKNTYSFSQRDCFAEILDNIELWLEHTISLDDIIDFDNYWKEISNNE